MSAELRELPFGVESAISRLNRAWVARPPSEPGYAYPRVVREAGVALRAAILRALDAAERDAGEAR